MEEGNIYGLNDTSRYVKNATEYALGGNAKEFGPKPSTRKGSLSGISRRFSPKVRQILLTDNEQRRGQTSLSDKRVDGNCRIWSHDHHERSNYYGCIEYRKEKIKESTENAEFGVSPKFFGLLITIETANLWNDRTTAF